MAIRLTALLGALSLSLMAEDDDLAPPGQPAEHFMIRAFGAAPAARLDVHPIFQEAGA